MLYRTAARPDQPRRTRLWTSSTLALFLVISANACADRALGPESSSRAGPPDAAAEIADAAHNAAIDHFYFLPPMVPDPTVDGVFDGSLSPDVTICELDVARTTCAATQPAGFPLVYTLTSGPDAETVTVDAAAEHYKVNWHSKDFPLDDQKGYRITVSVGSSVLGYADVDVVTSGNELKNVDTGEYIALKDGRTLPIKFRIEEGAIASAHLYVANLGDNTVSVIETSGNTVIATVPVGLNPRGVTVRPDGQVVYVANSGDQTISVIETASNTVIATIDIAIKGSFPREGPKEPRQIVFTADGTLAYTINNRAFGPNSGRTSVAKIDAINHVALDAVITVAAGAQRIILSQDESTIYISTTSVPGSGLWTIDPNNFIDNGEALAFGGQKTGIALLPGGTQGYTIELCCAVVKFDAVTNTPIGTVSAGGANDVQVSADGTRAYATKGSGHLAVIDTSIDPPLGGSVNADVASILLASSPRDVALTTGNDFAYVTLFSNEVAVIDRTSNTVALSIQVGTNPYGIAILEN